MSTRTVLVLGGGYAGLAALRTLSRLLDRARYRVRLLDASPHHTIKTRFHERAVVGTRELLLRLPLKTLVTASGAEFVQEEARGLDFRERVVHGGSGEHPYDLLLVALGGRTTYLGVEGADRHTESLQTFEAADHCARRVAELGIGRPGVHRRVVVCGAGIEGLEVAAMLRQIASREACEIAVVEKGREVMARSQCRPGERRYVTRYMEERGIELLLGVGVSRVDAGGVLLEDGRRLEADLVVWCSGVRRVEVAGLEPDTPFTVNRNLQSPSHPEVFASGDFATVDTRDELANLGSAQRAVYQGALAAENLWRHETLRPLRPARYRPIGEMVGFGDFDGVGVVYGIGVRGKAAALAKKANEVKYLAELCRDLPGSLARSVLSGGRGDERQA
ncbi:MAG: NAD(P)/FAD-dependent oxidoreductase [Deferrisomatales bacterium]